MSVLNNQKPTTGELADLQQRLHEAEIEIQYQRKAFDALLSIVQSLGETPSIELLFQQAADPVQAITGFSTFALRLYDEQQHQFILKSYKGFNPGMLQRLSRLPRPNKDWYVTKMVETKKAVIYYVPPEDKLDFHNVVFVPLLGNDRIVGSLDLGSKTVRVWTEAEIAWLELVGKYMGMVLNLIQLTDKLEALSALQEREHIAQELHDDTVQSISALILWAQEAQIDLDEDRLPAARKAVEKIEKSANLAYKSLREEIFSLRKKVEADEDILSVIQTCLDTFQSRWDIATYFKIEGQPLQSPLKLPTRTEIQLLRIIQEALTNVRKHAQATTVEVRMQIAETQIAIEILDNGDGFDPLVMLGDHLGLRIMRERAASLGGAVTIASTVGSGSSISINIPRG